jgi:hypothetical protein
MRKERLRWSKMKNLIVDKRNDLLKTFGGPEQAQKHFTPNQIRDKFSQVGIQLGDDDFKLFHSYLIENSTSKSSNEINFDQICDSIGVSIHVDNTRKPRKYFSSYMLDLSRGH